MNETFKKPPLLVRLALFFSPAEFRRRYADEIYRDSAGGEILRDAVDAFFAGVGMRVEDLWRDLCLGVRSLRKTPLFAIVSVVTIAVAVGLNTAMASIVGNILLRPLPYPDSGRLVFVTENLSFGPFTTP